MARRPQGDRVDDEPAGHRGGHRSAQDPPGVGIDHERGLAPPRPRRDIRTIVDAEPVRASGRNFRSTRSAGLGERGSLIVVRLTLPVTAPHRALQSQLAHQPLRSAPRDGRRLIGLTHLVHAGEDLGAPKQTSSLPGTMAKTGSWPTSPTRPRHHHDTRSNEHDGYDDACSGPDRPGPVETLQIRALPVHRPRPGWVLIEVRAFGLNRSELHTRLGLAEGVTFPRVPGIEATGVVAAPGGEFADGAAGRRR